MEANIQCERWAVSDFDSSEEDRTINIKQPEGVSEIRHQGLSLIFPSNRLLKLNVWLDYDAKRIKSAENVYRQFGLKIPDGYGNILIGVYYTQ